jgi:hypothetical protein
MRRLALALYVRKRSPLALRRAAQRCRDTGLRSNYRNGRSQYSAENWRRNHTRLALTHRKLINVRARRLRRAACCRLGNHVTNEPMLRPVAS